MEKEKEAKEGSEPKEQEDLQENDEEGSEDEASETDYSSADENILTKAGRCYGGGVSNRDRRSEGILLYFVGFPPLFCTVYL